MRHEVWSSVGWRHEVEAWIGSVLVDHDLLATGPVEQPRIRGWSTQLRVTTTAGVLWFKESTPALHFEAGLVETLGALAPEHVIIPLAVRRDRGWMLSRDGGPTLRSLARHGEALWVAVLQGYADLQRRVSAHPQPILAAGLPDLRPSRALTWAESYGAELHALPTDDPRRLGADEFAALLATTGSAVEAAGVLEGGPVPLSLEHNDLHDNNAFVPAPDEPLRFFDFGDAVWAHPFSSLPIPLDVVGQQWSVGADDPRLGRLVDAYLEVWSDLASVRELRALVELARPFSTLHRAHSWWLWMSTTEPMYWLEDGRPSADYLRQFTAEVTAQPAP